MSKEKIDLLVRKITAAKSILIFGHKNPDGDSLASVLGLRHLIADNFGKTADIIYDGNLPISYDFLPGRMDFVYAEKLPDKKYDLVIISDTGSFVQLDSMQQKFFDSATNTIKIDHHKTMDLLADVDIVDTDASSVCEIIYEIAHAAKWKINADAATCLYSGIYTDAQGFSFIDDSKPLLIAAALVDLGAKPRSISEGLKVATRGDIMAQAEVLADAEFFYNGQLAVASIPKALYKNLDSGETEIVLFLRRIRGVECIAILKEAHPEEIRVSLRSGKISVREIAESFGGGGHDLSAGMKIFANLPKAKKIIVESFKGIL
ncbi:MAG: bifunctional oligoribonuclease/PAP phosphatase NrnA [Alphaproteobacteria bacterium]|nr:bifunctional oligoribonuclease/PAP phosphatase NrnA [Alphaproteobacteria bacterium]